MTNYNHPLVYTPIEASTAGEEYVTFRRSHSGSGMPLYIPSMEYKTIINKDGEEEEKGFVPLMPGESCSLIARPGHAKTGLMLRWARERAKDLQARADAGDEIAAKSVVVVVSLEQKVEELRLFHVAAEEKISMSKIVSGKDDMDWGRVTKGLRKLHPVPIWFVGRSMQRRKLKSDLGEGNIYSALESIERWQDENPTQVIDSVFYDYLQKFRPPSHSGMVEYYGNLMNTIWTWGSDFMARQVIGVQAKREVDGRDIPIPLMDDGQWSSTIEQFSDAVLSLVRPCLYPASKKWDVEIMGKQQLLVTCLKRKLGPANFNSWVNFDPKYNQFSDTELKEYKFRVAQGRDE